MTQKVNIEIDANASPATKEFQSFATEIQKVSAKVDKASGEIAKSLGSVSKKMSVGLVAIGNVVANGIGKAFKALSSSMDDSVKRFDTLNNFPKVMSNLGQSTEASARSINYMAEYLTQFPTRLDDAATAVQRFTSANKNVEASTQIYLACNNALLAGGASIERQTSAMNMLSQAYAKGAFSAYEWRAIQTAMPAQLQQVAESMGYTSAAIGGDFYNALTTGKIAMNDFMKQVVKLNKEGSGEFASFEQQALSATAGVQTSMANLKNSIVKMGTAILDTLERCGGGVAQVLQQMTAKIKQATIYVQSLVLVVMRALSAVSNLFGKNKNNLSSETEKASSGMSNFAGSASDASGSLSDATKNAKKLANQLSKFDEMNVLKEPKPSDSATEGLTGGLGGVDLGNVDIAGNVDGQIDEIANKLQWLQKIFESVFGTFSEIGHRVFNELKQINWQTLGETIGSGINIATRFFGGLLETGISVYNVLAEDIKKWAQTVESYITPMWTHLKNGFTNIAQAIQPLLEPLRKAFETIANALLPAIEPILGSIADKIREMTPTLQEVIPKVADVIASIIDKLSGMDWGDILLFFAGFKGVSGLFGKASNAITSAGEATKNWNTFAQVANGYIGEISDSGLPTFFENTASGMAGIKKGTAIFMGLQKPVAKVKDLLMTLGTAARSPLQTLQGVVGRLGEGLKGLWGIVSAHPLASIAVALGALLMTNEDFRKSLGNLVQSILPVLMELLGAIWAAIQPLFPVLKELATTIIKTIVDLVNQMVPIFTQVIDFVSQLFTMLLPFIQELTPILVELITTLVSVLEPCIETIANVLSSILKVLSPILQLVANILATVLPPLMQIISVLLDILIPIIEAIIKVIEVVIMVVGAMFKFVGDIVSGIVALVSGLVEAVVKFFQWCWDGIVKIFSVVVDWFKGVFEGAWNGIKNIFGGIGKWFGDRWNDIKNALGAVGKWFGDVFSGAWEAVKKAFANVGSFFSGIWNKIKEIFGKVGTTIGDAVSGAFKAVVNTVLGFVEGFVNTPIRAINTLIDVINAVPGINLGHLNELHLPRMAKGGVVDRATVAMIGENGREAVVPLENNTEWLDELADRIGGGDEPIYLTVQIGEETIVDTLVEKIRDKSKIKNRNVLMI